MRITKEEIYELYAKACKADEIFSENLRRQFGKDACNARYFRHSEFDAETKAAHKAKREADNIYLTSAFESRFEPVKSEG